MLTILHDPTGASGVTTEALDYGLTIQANIERHLASGYGATLYINGQLIDNPAECDDLQRLATAMDSVRVICRPEGGGGGIFGAIGKFANIITFGLIGKLIPKPSIPNVSASVAKDSPNNRLSGQTNTARAYQAIPDIYGRVRAYPDLIQPSDEYYIDHVKYVTEWLCVGLGKYTRESIKSADTPLGDISGSSVEFFEPVGGDYPENGTTTISGVTEPFTVSDVNGQELVYPTAWPSETESADVVLVHFDRDFTVKVATGSKWDNLVSIVGTGNALVQFTYTYGGNTFNFNETCPVKSLVTAGGFHTFTFTAAAGAPHSTTQSGITVTIRPIGSSPIWVGPYTLPVTADRFRTNLIFQRGLKGSVTIRTQWWAIDSNGDEISGTRASADATYSADTYDYRAWSVVTIPAYGTARYRVRWQRLSGAVGDGNDVAKVEQLAALRYYATKTLPGVTVAKLVTKATESATSFSDRKFNLIATRHVRDLASTAVSASRDFRRAVVHEYVAVGGLDIADLDIDSLINIGDLGSLGYFDYTFDDEDVSVGERIETICNAARVFVSRIGLQYQFRRDTAQPYPAMQLDYRNLAASGDSVLTYNGFVPGQYNGVELEYVDPDKNVRAYVRYRITSAGTIEAGTASRPNKMKLAGCRNLTQANNRALLECRKMLYQRQSIADTVLNDGFALRKGDLVRWVDPNDFYGDDGLQAGEVLAIDGLNFATSEPINWNGNTTARVVFTTAEGYQTAVVTATPHDDGFAVASLPTGVYVANGSTQQLSSRYAIGVGLSIDAINSAGLYTITEIKPKADGTLDIEAAAYDSRIYEGL